jgi:hypothetical protein
MIKSQVLTSTISFLFFSPSTLRVLFSLLFTHWDEDSGFFALSTNPFSLHFVDSD